MARGAQGITQWIVIDGYNVLLHPSYPRRPGAPLESDREGLIGLVRTYAATLRAPHPVLLVFDARGVPLPAIEDAWLRVEFVPSADGRILECLTGERASTARVVTSDRELAQFVRERGAVVESTASFIERLFRRPRRTGAGRTAYAEEGKPSPPRGDALLRDLAEQSAPREEDQ